MTPTNIDYRTLIPLIQSHYEEGLTLLSCIRDNPDESILFTEDISDWRAAVIDSLGPVHSQESNALLIPLRKQFSPAERAMFNIPRPEQGEMERALHGLEGILEILHIRRRSKSTVRF